LEKLIFPKESMMGSLFDYCSHAEDLKPMYANFGLLPELKIRAPKKKRRAEKSKRGLNIMENFVENNK